MALTCAPFARSASATTGIPLEVAVQTTSAAKTADTVSSTRTVPAESAAHLGREDLGPLPVRVEDQRLADRPHGTHGLELTHPLNAGADHRRDRSVLSRQRVGRDPPTRRPSASRSAARRP